MRAPRIDVVMDDGRSVPLESLFTERPVALVFLRHFGCIFCREHAAWLAQHPELNVVFVAHGTPEESASFRAEIDSPHPFISDPRRVLFEAFGLRRAGLGQILNLHVLSRGAQAWKNGYRNGRPCSDPLQLGGSFVVDRKGEVTWGKPAADAADNAPPEAIAEALQAAGARELSGLAD